VLQPVQLKHLTGLLGVQERDGLQLPARRQSVDGAASAATTVVEVVASAVIESEKERMLERPAVAEDRLLQQLFELAAGVGFGEQQMTI